MPLLNPKQKSLGGTFTQVGDEPLSKNVIGVRLPRSVHEVIHNLPNRADWLRRVIVDAAKRELMNPNQGDPHPIEISSTDRMEILHREEAS